MRIFMTIAALLLSTSVVFSNLDAQAQSAPKRLAIKDGEVLPLGNHSWVSNCRSIMIGMPKVEILQGPPELSLSLKETQFLPFRGRCSKQVPGAILELSAKDITAVKEALLTYRINFKTKDGDRQSSGTYLVSMFPASAQSTGSPAPSADNAPAPSTDGAAKAPQ